MIGAEMNDNNLLRIGKISSVNYKAGMARVTYEDRDGATTGELPFLAWTYWMPAIADRVLVGHLSGASAAVILGPIWGESHQPGEYGAGIYRQEMSSIPGTAGFSYSASTGVLRINAAHIELDADDGDITVAALISRIRSLEDRVAALGG